MKIETRKALRWDTMHTQTDRKDSEGVAVTKKWVSGLSQRVSQFSLRTSWENVGTAWMSNDSLFLSSNFRRAFEQGATPPIALMELLDSQQ